MKKSLIIKSTVFFLIILLAAVLLPAGRLNREVDAAMRGNQRFDRETCMSTSGNITLKKASEANIVGTVDIIRGEEGAVWVRGWVFDRDIPSQAVSIHVYLGGPAGVGVGYAFTANKSRPDVNSVYPGVGENHGFDEKIFTDRTGALPVYIYAINIGQGSSNPVIGNQTVTVVPDITKPAVKFQLQN
ncbi:MAG: hypothetical protein Q4B70_09515 [Lachnospiraceae bacterium]|nr:hypothetical protein [Lachnospiraceae bacterium]